MKTISLSLIAAFTLFFSFGAIAETCSVNDGAPVENCLINDVDGNFIFKWKLATERDKCPDDAPPECIDDKPLPVNEIRSTKVYFHDIVNNHWKDVHVPNQYTALKYRLAPGSYEIFATTIDTDSRESVASTKVNQIIDDAINEYFTLPNAPTVIEIESARSNIIRILIE